MQELEAAEDRRDSSQERHLATLQDQLAALQQQVSWQRMNHTAPESHNQAASDLHINWQPRVDLSTRFIRGIKC